LRASLILRGVPSSALVPETGAGNPMSGQSKGSSMNDDKVLMTLILDKEMVVTDEPCDGATLIAQYADGYFAFAITADGTCVLGFEGEDQVSLNLSQLHDLFRAKQSKMLH
jgi:hypothetical protein